MGTRWSIRYNHPCQKPALLHSSVMSLRIPHMRGKRLKVVDIDGVPHGSIKFGADHDFIHGWRDYLHAYRPKKESGSECRSMASPTQRPSSYSSRRRSGLEFQTLLPSPRARFGLNPGRLVEARRGLRGAELSCPSIRLPTTRCG